MQLSHACPAPQDFQLFLRDDAALLRAANAHWLLVPSAHANAAAAEQSAALDAAAASGNGQVPAHVGTFGLWLP